MPHTIDESSFILELIEPDIHASLVTITDNAHIMLRRPYVKVVNDSFDKVQDFNPVDRTYATRRV